MADDVDPRAGELVTANYGWTKPTVGASDDQWGGYLNTDLDGIDSVVHGIDVRPAYVLPTASTTVLGGVKVDGSTISISGGVISGTAPQGPPVTISDTPPASPQVGALWWNSNATGSGSGQLYTWFNDGNSSQWVSASNDGGVIPPASTTMLGGVKVDGTTIKAAADGTISTTVVPMGDNRIINGDMRIDVRNGGASGTAIGYTVDRWQFSASLATKGSWQRPTISSLPGFPYALVFAANSAYSVLAGDYFLFMQPIEADMISDFWWGTPQAQPVTLSFWANSTLSGTFGGSLRNIAATRTYPFSYTLAANTWTKIVITIPGDTTGTWVMSGNAGGAAVVFGMGVGSTFSGPANAWAATNYMVPTGSASVVGAGNGQQFLLTGVKLEIGSVATPYNRQSLTKSMADCQRYYQRLQPTLIGYAVATSSVTIAGFYPVAPRGSPTINIVANACSNVGTPTFSSSVTGMAMSGTVVATGGFTLNAVVEAVAEL